MSMVQQVKIALEKAERFESKLPPDTLPLVGYSGHKGRHLLNNLAALFTPYVEVGCFRGSTLICAAYDNAGLILGVDNFTDECRLGEYMVETRRALLQNMAQYSDRSRCSLIDSPCWAVNLTGVPCCFYDGGHTEQDHANALVMLARWFCGQFVFVVDDFNRQGVRDGTQRGIDGAKLTVDFYAYLGAAEVDDTVGYWSGMGVYVLSKPRSSTFG
jgi:hypothetical protein